MLAALKQFFSPSVIKRQSFDAYVRIIAQARHTVFYKDWQVADTVDGRFDVIVLHLFLVLLRCEDEIQRPEVQSFTRYLSEAFFEDMDRSLREMGASDTGVGIRVKNMAEAYFGRLKAYRASIGEETSLAEVLRRNVYREKATAPEAVASLAAYMGRNRQILRTQPVDEIMKGVIQFSG